VRSYRHIDDAVVEVNRRDRPLALYYFGSDAAERRQVLDRTISGGVTLDDVIFHVGQEELPFGGIGPSGTGAYHGEAGFRTFSHARSIYKQARLDVAGLAGVKPPYGKATWATIRRQMK
jgi:coniferyl-aldehyde dehydrogenase